jgi:hypothetical protein
MSDTLRDLITIEDEKGNHKDYMVEALFDMNEKTFALLKSKDETILMRVEDEEGDQYLFGITDPSESEAILNAYQIAVENAPAK